MHSKTRLNITNDSKHSGGSWNVPKALRLVGKARHLAAKVPTWWAKLAP